jgi:type II secretory pathway component PulF
MNYDEFSFFNQQLAAMLRDGIPLEGALRQLCAGMKDSQLRAEITALEQELSQGAPLPEALSRRSLPDLYVQLVRIGAKGNDLPGTLTLLADHYQRANALWTRLKGLMVYPAIVVSLCIVFTFGLSLVFSHYLSDFMKDFTPDAQFYIASMWFPSIVLFLVTLAVLVVVARPTWRARLRWRLPAFREASLAQTASAMAILLKNGVPLPDALALVENLESGTPAAITLNSWNASVRAGYGRPSHWTGPTTPFPPLFLWLVQQGGEDLAAGFQKAADIYQARAGHRIEMALYGVLPVSMLLVGQMVFWQIAPLMKCLLTFMRQLGDMGG